MATKLSVNLNKVALVRNSRGGGVPDIVEAARIVVAAGCDGLTLHPRADSRHATLEDVYRLAAMDVVASGEIELNIEGDLRPELMRVIEEVRPTQFTMVPVLPGEVTTTKGWRAGAEEAKLREAIAAFTGKVRISLFVDPAVEGVRLAAEVGAQAIELHTYDYARAYGKPGFEAVVARYEEAAREARRLGLRVHAGHDLDRENLGELVRRIYPEEVSIGHALITEALLTGLPGVTGEYVKVIREGW
ncbi:MAG: pyridoxine 5'-phosphate synthase [Acidobacteriota bacterium]|nr:pyridoxine 5'-phosphate synthase [Acidobacteriota bacterium]